MNDIVIIKRHNCFITSDVLAENAQLEHRAISQLIRNHLSTIEAFGHTTFEMSNLSQYGRKTKVYFLNESQAVFLMSLMKNSPRVINFKRQLVKEFFRMRKYIQKQETSRLLGIRARRTLTDEIRDTGENERMHGHGFSAYTRLAYKLTGIQKGDRDKLSPEDLDRLENVESLMKGYLKAGQDYQKIKDALEPLFTLQLSS